MRFSRFCLPAGLFLMFGTPVCAAVLETATIDNWSLAAYSNNRTRDFQSCTMSVAAGEGTDFVLSLNGRNRWALWLRRSEWPIEQDETIVATLNLDTGKKAGIAIETTLESDHMLALPLSRDEKLPGLFDRASTVRVALEHKLHVTVSLKNYAKAVDWVKGCAARHAAPQSATTPDATIRSDKNASGHDDGMLDMEPDAKETKPAPIKPGQEKPAKNPDLIEASLEADTGSSEEKPAIAAAIATLATAMPAPAVPAQVTPAPAAPAPVKPASGNAAPVKPEPPPQSQSPQAGTPSQIVAGISAALSTAARATTADVLEPRPGSTARDLVPGLMQAAKLTSFKILPDTQAPGSLRRADAVFELEGFRAAVVSLEAPSAATGINEILAHDRIACGGAYASNSAAVDPASNDVMRATTRCEAGGQVTVGHFVTIARKSGGYYVVAVMGQVAAMAAQTNPIGEVSATLDEAALNVTGKF